MNTKIEMREREKSGFAVENRSQNARDKKLWPRVIKSEKEKVFAAFNGHFGLGKL